MSSGVEKEKSSFVDDVDSVSDDGAHILLDLEVSHSFVTRFTKRTFDISGALVFFAFFGWLYLVIWICVLVTSGSPGIYSQLRYGRDGKIFRFYKFRSMVNNAPSVLDAHLASDPTAKQEWDEFQKLEADPRVTNFGRLIRKTSLDELPQFWNVLIGDMSLVGPRPCLIDQKILYSEFWKYYVSVKPGITGLWQVSGRNKLSYRHRVTLDVQYVKKLSILQDLTILFKTVYVVAIGHGSR